LTKNATARCNIEIWRAHHSSTKHQSTTTLQLYQAFSKNVDEQHYRSYNFKGEDVLLSRIPMIPTDMPFEFKHLKFPE